MRLYPKIELFWAFLAIFIQEWNSGAPFWQFYPKMKICHTFIQNGTLVRHAGNFQPRQQFLSKMELWCAFVTILRKRKIWRAFLEIFIQNGTLLCLYPKIKLWCAFLAICIQNGTWCTSVANFIQNKTVVCLYRKIKVWVRISTNCYPTWNSGAPL